jgi:DNA-binding CsgD family transcriptional regulator
LGSHVSEVLSESSPDDLYRSGFLGACIRATAGAASLRERILNVRSLSRKACHREALNALASARPATPEDEALLLALKSSCFSYLGDVQMARSVLAEVRPLHYGLDVRFELVYAQALIGWVAGDTETMTSALNAIDVRSTPHLYGRWLYARSWVAALREDYQEQLYFLELAARQLADVPAAYDAFLLATTTRSLVHLVREVSGGGSFGLAVRLVESMQWTEDLVMERFLTFRGMAWAHALRGSHEKAFQYAYLARDIAPSELWVTASYADQAYLARMAGDHRSADALLNHAVDCANRTQWTSQGEERVALLNLIELSADRSPATARALLSKYEEIPAAVASGLAYAHGHRLFAMEEYARGTVLAVSGHRTEAVERLANVYQVFRTVRYAWRAAATALRLHVITGHDAWLRCAREAVRDFPDSSVADEIRKRASAAEDPRVAALTPAQRRVFALMCEGLSDKQIAETLCISRETAKNHAAKVRGVFGVRSRAALIASTAGWRRAG